MSKRRHTKEERQAINTVEDVISSMQLELHTKKVDDKEVIIMLGIYINRLVERIQNAYDALTIERVHVNRGVPDFANMDSLINQWIHR